MRPPWDTYFLDIATAVARRADCTRAQYGAVVVLDHRIISTGYNGSPPGGPSCLAGECPRGSAEVAHNTPDYSDCIALHAEANAIAWAHAALSHGTIYIAEANGEDRGPCDMCAKLITASGLAAVVTKVGSWRVTPMGLRSWSYA